MENELSKKIEKKYQAEVAMLYDRIKSLESVSNLN